MTVQDYRIGAVLRRDRPATNPSQAMGRMVLADAGAPAAAQPAVQASDVIIPQDSAQSLLVRVLVSGEMPEDGSPLSAELIQTIREWIDAGALDN